jgi:hypothetical protein
MKYNYKQASEGSILLPMVLMLFAATLILFALAEHFYVHILLTKETARYMEAQKFLAEVIPTIEQELSLNAAGIPKPRNQEELLSNIQDWPELNSNTHTYSQLIHQDSNIHTYSTLIVISDSKAEQRLIYELISSCTLADNQCNPLQLTQL